jgi:hypothetical protein
MMTPSDYFSQLLRQQEKVQLKKKTAVVDSDIDSDSNFDQSQKTKKRKTNHFSNDQQLPYEEILQTTMNGSLIEQIDLSVEGKTTIRYVPATSNKLDSDIQLIRDANLLLALKQNVYNP